MQRNNKKTKSPRNCRIPDLTLLHYTRLCYTILYFTIRKSYWRPKPRSVPRQREGKPRGTDLTQSVALGKSETSKLKKAYKSIQNQWFWLIVFVRFNSRVLPGVLTSSLRRQKRIQSRPDSFGQAGSLANTAKGYLCYCFKPKPIRGGANASSAPGRLAAGTS